MKALALIPLALALAGCLSSAPIVPETPANSAQIGTCENAATGHNDLMIGDFVLTGSAAGLGAAGAIVSDTQAKTGLAIGATAAAGAAILTSSLVALYASDFANNGCTSVVGALPTAPLPARTDVTTVTVTKP